MTARAIQSGVVDLESLHTLPTDDARIALRRLRGVGEKVANCILLFAYERFEAFPVDVWIARILRQDYGIAKADATPARLREFAANHFGPYGGYAQQYLFHHGRTSRKRGSRADASVPVFIDGGE
jgi:N-glycosylase/DNA lyase